MRPDVGYSLQCPASAARAVEAKRCWLVVGPSSGSGGRVHGNPRPGGQGHITPVRRAQQDLIVRAEPVSLAVFAAIFAFFAMVALVDIMVIARGRLRGEPRLSHGPAVR